jgi:hypothetical protein
MPEWLVSPNSTVWLVLERISVLLSYLVVGTIAAFVFNLFRYRRKRKELATIAGKAGHPRALALSFGGGSIEQAVKEYLSTIYPEVNIPVEKYEKDEVTAENIHRYEEAVRRLKERFQSENVTELHLFMKGPVALALAVGAIFDNWVGVKVYHSKREGGYESWTTLHQAKAAPVAEELTERILQAVDNNPR